MRLLNVETFNLETFYEPDVPPYSALSHTWGPNDREVSFQDITNGFDMEQKDWDKVSRSAAETKSFGLQYIWIDTCCIDKSSSAELSEAINSMFRWYRECVICLAYLSDVLAEGSSGATVTGYASQLSKSRWFTRGWTLQELIAPNELHFYDATWNYFGQKAGLAKDISSITGIDVKILDRPDQVRTMSIAQRMSWASDRKTTRVEDIAYCLMGIFDVNMPLLYGEGQKAFSRLQEEIMRRSSD